MATPRGQAKSKETAKAAQAFADYVAMGNARSLRALHEKYRQSTSRPPAKSLETLYSWSIKHNWQARIATAASEAAERMLADAADLDAETFLESSRLLNERMKYATREHADAIVKMRESVRKPAPKGGTSVDVNVNVGIEIREMVERAAQEDGLTEGEKQELMKRVQGRLAESR